jgi:hypothetical protein
VAVPANVGVGVEVTAPAVGETSVMPGSFENVSEAGDPESGVPSDATADRETVSAVESLIVTVATPRSSVSIVTVVAAVEPSETVAAPVTANVTGWDGAGAPCPSTIVAVA